MLDSLNHHLLYTQDSHLISNYINILFQRQIDSVSTSSYLSMSMMISPKVMNTTTGKHHFLHHQH